MKTIIIIEDCPSVNLFYQKLFDSQTKWQLTTCCNFEDALKILEEQTFDLIISDGYVKESKITGLDFLKIAKIKFPETVSLYVSDTIMPQLEDYQCFNAFINKKDLLGEELLGLVNCIGDEDSESLPDNFLTNVFLS
ncbi:MAG: hypothetical protein MK132_12320 [Lentisphaerales bacterium]|nr:hypothetical protein [Lentisphaerales bacterium]